MAAMASLALPGMSGFASEIAVFLGMTTSDIYSSPFRTVTIGLSAVGLILTPIYLLSMVRQVFYGTGANLVCDVVPTCDLDDLDLKTQGNEEPACFGTNCVLPVNSRFEDASPREVFIAACFLALIIAIGVYPKLPMQLYDVKTVAVNAQVRDSYAHVTQDNPQLYAKSVWNSTMAETHSPPLLGIIK
jgi:NAD(P)H-quinone oxidoreductase subunit 4